MPPFLFGVTIMLTMHLVDRGQCKFCGRPYNNMESKHVFVHQHKYYTIEEADDIEALLCVHHNIVGKPFTKKEDLIQQIYG